jgi:hypothetical protein
MKQNPITRGSFALTSIAFTALALLSFGNVSAAEDQSAPAIPVPGKPAVAIPFPESLRRADVEVAAMKDGQRESLILGNGDLYGIVWEKDNGLFMRLTKNDI